MGHTRTCEALEKELPSATLLWGPGGIGKAALVRHVLAHHGYHKHDVVGSADARVDMETARSVLEASATRPFGKAGRVVVGSLDGASAAAVNALLKVVEEPPPRTRFVFTAEAPPLLTIRSRCFVFRLGLLSDAEVAQVLEERLGYEEHRAYRVARLGRGSVRQALTAERAEGSKGVVVSALRGVAEGDVELLQNALRVLDDDGLWLLRTWVREARTGRWVLYGEGERFGLEKDVRNLDIVLAMLSRQGRPRLLATAALDGWRRQRSRNG